MTDREAMQMALEALNLPSMKTMQMLRQRDEAITALRAKLEQPEQRKPLTDAKIWEIHDACIPPTEGYVSPIEFARAVEAKLKEKNHDTPT